MDGQRGQTRPWERLDGLLCGRPPAPCSPDPAPVLQPLALGGAGARQIPFCSSFSSTLLSALLAFGFRKATPGFEPPTLPKWQVPGSSASQSSGPRPQPDLEPGVSP